ncbi:hypothetical protein P170DRAFT_434850 [Aspergillus steynii IBT 23096]|uniref:Uncharacterized protein n=1 Tax=Aspergillus steynii IBT 23096 TaxID=1392250 RepID=A0A2I2GJT2_9EURO|nr:uncharacterized protein P170DRAFT_434850 [Aspergillus steynii IBT 23096]PLB53130.1 hypothetical protein P170DRAFT_434850 [Aspergillus steynii IBT 23096]
MSNNRKTSNPTSEVKRPVEAQTTSRSRSEVRSSSRPRNNIQPSNAQTPVSSGTRRNAKVVSEPKKSADSQRARSEIGGYTAPNGTHLRVGELQRLSCGVKVPNKDTAYFRPSFVEDPWKDVKPIMTECSNRWW